MIISTTPFISQWFSPIVRNIVIPQTNRFCEIIIDHDSQYSEQHISSYYQPKPATELLYYQPQPTKCNQR